MKYLLDSHALLWALANSPHLPARVKSALSADGAEVWFSTVSAYELGFQVMLRRLPPFPQPIRLLSAAENYSELSVTAEHAEHAARLPLIHRDPWDRIIAAQALVEGMTVATVDKQIVALGVRTIW